MTSSTLEKFLERAASEKALAKALRLSPGGMIGEVAEPAQPFVAALLLRQMPGRVWMVCRDVRGQEDFAAELAAWCPRVRIFPDIEIPSAEALPDAETESERLEILRSLAQAEGNEVVVIHSSQWKSPTAARDTVLKEIFSIAPGEKIEIDEVVKRLVSACYEEAPQITARGQFAKRGGILDVFSWQQPRPVRMEWFDLEIESLREFDLDTQSSVGTIDHCEIFTGRAQKSSGHLRDFLRPGDSIVTIEPGETFEGIGLGSGGEPDAGAPAFYPPPFADMGAGDLVLNEVKRDRFFNQLHGWAADHWHVAFVCNNEGEGERFRELASDFDFDADKLVFLTARATRGFVCPALKIALLAESEILGRSASQRSHRATLRRERLRGGRATMDFSDFEEGDLVVHLDHGIGRYAGLEPAPDGGGDVLVLEFANDARLFVPLDQAWQVARYVGLGKKYPDLSELGGGRWQRAKEKATKGIYEYAARMLKVQAERETAVGHVFSPDSHWQQEFERSFLFTETPDQLKAIRETKSDMESPRAMDRLICGDVGFGKTEVAIRAAFKAVTDGKQAAIIAPTTVLAQQHYQNFRERMSEYPVNIELLSRYRTAAEQK
jgi:transcription-repair coupling factor (superfamily II helicase)